MSEEATMVSTTQQPEVELFSTIDFPSKTSYGLSDGATVKQAFRAQCSGKATRLRIQGGANRHPFGIELRLFCNQKLLFEDRFKGIVQRQNVWDFVLDFGEHDVMVRRGDWIRFEITLRDISQIGVEPTHGFDDADCPKAILPGYGDIVLRFAMDAEPLAAMEPHLAMGQYLRTGTYLQSPMKTAFAVLQEDGNFCVYRGSGPSDNQGFAWGTQRAGSGERFAIMQKDGNFCVYSGTGPADNQSYVWCRATKPLKPGEKPAGQAYFAMVGDGGQLLIFEGQKPGPGAKLLWWSPVGAAK